MHPATILLIKPGSLGDVVHALPTVAALRDAYPSAKLTWVIDPRWSPILEGTDLADELLEFPREQFRGIGGKIKALAWYRALADLRPDLAIDLQGLLRSALIAHASRPRRIIGLSDAREGARHFYSQVADTTPATHAVDRYLQILPALSLPIPADKRFPLPNRKSKIENRKSILLHPFARGAAKSLSPDAVRTLANLLSPTPLTLVGIGPPIPDLPPNVADLTNRTTLPELIEILRHAAAVISVDSGPMHLAAALDAPLLAIHTWSDPRRVGPYRETAWVHQGGQLRQQSPGARKLPPSPLTEDDLRAIATWAKAQS